MNIKISKQFIFFAILILAFSWGVSFGLFISPDILPEKNMTVAEIEADVEIDYGDENSQVFAGEYFWEGSSVLDLLKTLERRHGIALETREFSEEGEIFVDGINGVRSTKNSFWKFLVNGEEIQSRAEDYLVKDGDKISWKRI